MNLLFRHLLLFLIFAFWSNLFLFSQKSFVKTIDSVKSENFVMMEKTSDGGWITATSTKTYNPDPQKSGLLIVKYSKCSLIEWSKYYYFTNDNFNFSDILIETNGNIMICGYSCFYDACNAVVIYLASNGNLIWCKTLTSLSKYVYSIGKTSDNNYFIFGIITDINASMPCNYIVKFNSIGNILWSYKYFDNPVWGDAVAVESNNILVRSGNLIYKINSAGNLIWSKRYSGLHYSSKPLISNDGYTFANFPSTENDSNSFVFKLNLNGDLQFTGNAFKCSSVGKIKRNNNGNLLITGSYKDNSGNKNINLVETTVAGNILNQKLINNQTSANVSRGCDFIVFQDNSLLITAKNEVNAKLSLIKTNDLQQSFCGETTISQIFSTPTLTVSNELGPATNLSLAFYDININILSINLNETTNCYVPENLNLDLGNDTTLCPGSQIILKSNINGNYTFLWSTGEVSSQITVSKEGKYWLKVTGCDTITDTIIISYTKGLNIDFTINPTITELGNKIVFSNNTKGFKSYFWESGDGNIYQQNKFEHIYKNFGYFYPIIHYTDSFNCTYTDSSKVEIRYFSIYIPNSFTPDGDGLNEIFDIKGEAILNYKLLVFNRWGELISKTENEGWDGTFYGNYCKPDIYNYIAEIRDIFGRYYQRKGSVNLIR